MVNKVYSGRISEFAHENGGRVLLLFLLFCLAIYEFITAGLPVFAIICILPILFISSLGIRILKDPRADL